MRRTPLRPRRRQAARVGMNPPRDDSGEAPLRAPDTRVGAMDTMRRGSELLTLADRLAALDWPALEAGLWERGWASTPDVLAAEECDGLIRAYGDDRLFRSRVDMERHRFGVGDYKYFA